MFSSQIKVFVVFCCSSNYATDVASGMVHTVALLLNLAEAHMLHRGFILLTAADPLSCSLQHLCEADIFYHIGWISIIFGAGIHCPSGVAVAALVIL